MGNTYLGIKLLPIMHKSTEHETNLCKNPLVAILVSLHYIKA